jgi:hypothetical protein
VRSVVALVIPIAAVATSCVSTPDTGSLGEGTSLRPTITAVDTARPPRSAWVQMDQPGYAALLLVAPGHSATLLYPDSLTNNQLNAGAHQLTFAIADALLPADSVLRRQRSDTAPRVIRSRPRPSGPSTTPIPPTVPTYLLLVTSPQQLSRTRILEKTVGVSIPTLEMEALNAVGKAIKSTLLSEPRDWAGYYQRVELRRKQ